MTTGAAIHLARVRDPDPGLAGARILVDRLWPRGIRKDVLKPDLWLRDIAPSNDLRQWFGHEVDKWPEFQTRYHAELDANPEAVAQLLDWCRKGPVVLLFDAHEAEHNNAVALRDYLLARLDKGAQA